MKEKSLEIDKILKPYNEEIKRHMTALSEEFQEKLQVVAEGVSSMDEKLERFNSEIREEMKKNHADMLFGFKSIRNDLKKKLDYEEFSALERRVDTIESKLKN